MSRKRLILDSFDAIRLNMTIYEKNGKYYCRFQIDGERHHYLCQGAKNTKDARKIEDGFRYRLQQQQNGIIIRTDKKVRLKNLIQLYEQYSELNKLSYGKDAYGKYIGLFFGVDTGNFCVCGVTIAFFVLCAIVEHYFNNFAVK